MKPFLFVIGLFGLIVGGFGVFLLVGAHSIDLNSPQPIPGTVEAYTAKTMACEQKQAAANAATKDLQSQLQAVNDKINALGAAVSWNAPTGSTTPIDQLAARSGPDMLQQYQQLAGQYLSISDQIDAIRAQYAC